MYSVLFNIEIVNIYVLFHAEIFYNLKTQEIFVSKERKEEYY